MGSIQKQEYMENTTYNLSNRSALFEVAEEIEQDGYVNALVDLMKQALFNSKIEGVGLAAPQIGVSKRIIIVWTTALQVVLINPVITRRRLGKYKSKERCLSFPDKIVPIKRDKQIIVEGFNQNWAPVKLKLRGLESYVVQHEIDHLDGITINNPRK